MMPIAVESQAGDRWRAELDCARSSVRAAAAAIDAEFGQRHVTLYRGRNDVQLRADLTAERIIIDNLERQFGGYGIVSEESYCDRWDDNLHLMWAVDPLDGTNNFGYGVAHCAIAITLFAASRVVLAVVYDPIIRREFLAAEGRPFSAPTYGQPGVPSMKRSTISMITGYSDDSRAWGSSVEVSLREQCKRVYNLWAPALDLALIASGAVDGAVCLGAAFLDVCAGIYLVQKAGGVVLGLNGEPVSLDKALHRHPLSFVASRSRPIAEKLAAIVST